MPLRYVQHGGMGSMRKLLAGLVALACGLLLSSCFLLPFVLGPIDREQADARMAQIEEAVNSHDAAALKALFSPHALDLAPDMDARVEYFLSLFPHGILSWESDALWAEGSDGYGTEMLHIPVTVTTDGGKFELSFADFTVHENQDYVGLYALGATPWVDGATLASGAFRTWAGSMRLDESSLIAYPGVYFPPDASQLAIQKLNLILDVVNNRIYDAEWLGSRFSDYVRYEHPTRIDDELEELYAHFPDQDVARQEDPPVTPVYRESVDSGGEKRLILASYRVSSGGSDYWLSFAYFTDYSTDPDKVGYYAMGIAPWTASGDSPAETALFAWLDRFDLDATVPPGVFVAP